MKRLRATVVLAVVVCLVCFAWTWLAKPRAEFATPLECLEAYRDACVAGDGVAQSRCLADDLRALLTQRFGDLRRLGEAGRDSLAGVVSWAANDARTIETSEVRVDVEETRRTGRQLVCFHLRQSTRGWQITAIEPPRSLGNETPYGTKVGR